MELYQFIRNRTFEILIRPKYYPCDMPVASQILDFSRTLTQWHDFLKGLGLEMKDNSFGKNHPRGKVLSGSLCFGSSQSPIAFMLSFDDVLINEPCSVSVCYLINNRINQIFWISFLPDFTRDIKMIFYKSPRRGRKELIVCLLRPLRGLFVAGA